MRVSRLLQSITFGMLFGVTQIVHANLITNGSFESPASAGSPSLPNGSTYLTNWTVINAEIAQICPGCFGITASDGSYSLDLAGYHDAAPYGGVQQVIATVPFAVYDISFDVGAVSGTSGIQVSAGNLLNNGFSTASGLTWTPFSSTFTALSTTTAISLIGTQASAGGGYIGLDNVSVQLNHLPSQVHEPATWMLIEIGLVVFIGLNRSWVQGHRCSGIGVRDFFV